MFLLFFFFKQKTAYEIMPSLVGSEMCIRDSLYISQMISDGRNHRMPPRCAKPAHWRVSASDSGTGAAPGVPGGPTGGGVGGLKSDISLPVSYTHLRAHETRHDLVCRLLLEKKK